jgi:valyl-tRNA synthetase
VVSRSQSLELILLTIATTRPETIPGDTAVAVNPKDPRYAHLIGKHVVRPLPAELPREQKLIPIIGDEHVDFEFGTGVLKVTPAHDKADFEIGCAHKSCPIEVINRRTANERRGGRGLARTRPFQGAQSRRGKTHANSARWKKKSLTRTTSVTANAPMCRSSRA